MKFAFRTLSHSKTPFPNRYYIKFLTTNINWEVDLEFVLGSSIRIGTSISVWPFSVAYDKAVRSNSTILGLSWAAYQAAI